MAKTGIPEAIEALEKAEWYLRLAWLRAKEAGDKDAMMNLDTEEQNLLEIAKRLHTTDRYFDQPRLARFFKG